MMVWDHGVEILRESIFAYAQVCSGNLGVGILAVTFLARLALLPIGIRAARATLTHQRTMQRVQPEFTFIAAVSGSSTPAPNQRVMMLVSTVVTIIALTKMSAGVALYWAMSSLFGAVQGFVMARANRASAA
jgi:membrane protein insertase Oxa1/YidC/SpoIIIJ